MCLCLQTREPNNGKSIEKRRNESIWNRTKLSSYMRKRTSARDKRKTSRIVGIVAAIILVMYGVLLGFLRWYLDSSCNVSFKDDVQKQPNTTWYLTLFLEHYWLSKIWINALCTHVINDGL